MTDEEEIRTLVSTWMSATKAGDIDRILGLMTDDVMFLIPGREPMRKAEFAAVSHVQPGQPRPKIDGASEIQEIKVCGDHAFMWSRLSVTVTTPNGETIERAGHTLSVLRKENGKWLLARDANMVVKRP
jgi:uncharacterized protein (TIGR02246 family)